MRQRRTSGFTIIELLVVIAIIGVLSSIAIYYVSIARNKGKDSKAVTQTQNLAKAMEAYYADHGQYPYEGMYDSGGWHEYTLTNNPPWTEVLTDLTTFQNNMRPYMDPLPDTLTGANGTPKTTSVIITDSSFTGMNGSTPQGVMYSNSDGENYCRWLVADSYIILTRLSTKNDSPVANPVGFKTWNYFIMGKGIVHGPAPMTYLVGGSYLDTCP